MNSDIIVRMATTGDAPSIRDIYAPYVTDTAISFEFEVPSVKDFEQRITSTIERYPFLVAEVDGEVVGFAYAGRFRDRPAYDASAEVSVYVKNGFRRKGVGSKLYGALESVLTHQNVRLICACIAVGEDRLDDSSIRFHEKMGYTEAARFDLCAYKFDRWYGIVWMTKSTYPGKSEPREFVPYNQLIWWNAGNNRF